MKNKKVFIAAAVIIVIILGFIIMRPAGQSSSTSGTKDYYCPMHPNYTSDKPGECPICGMSLVKRQTSANQPAADIKTQTTAGVYINSEKQQLIGVKTEKIEKRRLTGQVLTVGIVAYDPDLFVAQQEYLQSIQTRQTMQSSSLKYTDEQLNPLVNATKRKLLLLGMSNTEIAELEKKGQPQQYLYLPENGKVWVYITIYEYEMALVKETQAVQIETAAYPGEVFEGIVVSVAPIFDRTARTLKVRVLVKDPENKLKPEMYVDAKIIYDLGEKLAVPNEAVMDSGTKKIVFIAEPNGYFESREVKLGPKVQGYYEVLQGLTENQTVVTSGNFLVDSESKLNAVLTQNQ
ncbi:MAG: efflux RND transporter periplasmic adaptor subunit [Sedimentisphaerales bacterium]|jgi:Cu(I)/Ag(I) efflux system membrane fusion protein